MSLRKRPALATDSARHELRRRRTHSPSYSRGGGGGDGSHDPHLPRRPAFPSHLDDPNLPPKVRLLCELLSSAPSAASVEPALDDAGVRVSSADVESVLRLSYSHPGNALAFFRWAGSRHLAHQHSPYSWNLVVDLLGKNLHFDAMWDAVRSMRAEGLLSLATFASIFSSLAAAARPSDAVAAFLSMPGLGIPRDTVALNSLLSALCRAGRTADARAALPRVRAEASVSLDADTFAILLEGCENEADPQAARHVFDEMILVIGWDPTNVPAYDSFLTTLISSNAGNSGLSEAMQYLDRMRQRGCFPGIKFFRAALQAYVDIKDARGASALWEEFVERRRCMPDTSIYNSMIALQCYLNETEAAIWYLDDMVFYGVFPDSQTYNVLLQFLLKSRKLREAAAIFNEMVKNNCLPIESNCTMALRVFLDTGDSEMGIRVWKFMVANDLPSLEENGNMLVSKLRDMEKLPEACKYAEDMIDKGIKLSSSTLAKLKQSLLKVGKGSIHEYLLRKWKSH